MLNRVTCDEGRVLDCYQAQYLSAKRIVRAEEDRKAFGRPEPDEHGRRELTEATDLLRGAKAVAEGGPRSLLARWGFR